MDFEFINERFCSLRDQIAIKKGDPRFFELSLRPECEGAPHIEIDGDQLHFVICERGVEYKRQTTSDLDTLLYWLIAFMTPYVAEERLRQEKNPSLNEREVWFREEESILGKLNPEWAERKRIEHDWLQYPEKRDELPWPLDFFD